MKFVGMGRIITVIPAEAGTQQFLQRPWIPAFAGMTN